jgi:hypothetical protein
MKAILEFELPEDQHAFQRTTKALDLASVLWDMDQYLRNKMKYECENMSKEVYETHKEIRSHLSNLMEEHDLNFDTLL